MSKKGRKVAIALFISCSIATIISASVAVGFFTKENISKDTMAEADMQELPNEETSKNEDNTQEQAEIKEDVVENNEEEKVEEVVEPVKIETKTKSSSSAKKVKTSTGSVSEEKNEEESENQLTANYKGFSTVGKIEIPKTGLNIPILSKVTSSGMEVAPCLLYSTGSLNISGNTLIVGHNYKNGKIFSNNKNVQIGDKIYITTLDGKRVGYTVYNKFTTTSDEVDYLERDTSSGPEITLSTCSAEGDTRIIILAN